ncbi:hypothetical protein KFK09_024440 [Dendrobium nobile]|uniref:Uncharacterized protein n=1 Tax=Dendrobium nobile TaxID=94219 RepID=A0A8T3ADU1_DENNO|nr:hypothetical protein KFK09_024440 [Dendrobium nobile]
MVTIFPPAIIPKPFLIFPYSPFIFSTTAVKFIPSPNKISTPPFIAHTISSLRNDSRGGIPSFPLRITTYGFPFSLNGFGFSHLPLSSVVSLASDVTEFCLPSSIFFIMSFKTANLPSIFSWMEAN